MGNFATNETDMKCFHIKTILVSHNNDVKIGLPIYKYKYIYIGYKLHYTIITSCENLLNNRMLFGNEAKYKDNDIAEKINNPLTGYAFFFCNDRYVHTPHELLMKAFIERFSSFLFNVIVIFNPKLNRK